MKKEIEIITSQEELVNEKINMIEIFKIESFENTKDVKVLDSINSAIKPSKTKKKGKVKTDIETEVIIVESSIKKTPKIKKIKLMKSVISETIILEPSTTMNVVNNIIEPVSIIKPTKVLNAKVSKIKKGTTKSDESKFINEVYNE